MQTNCQAYLFVFGMVCLTTIAQLLFKQAGLYSVDKIGIVSMWVANYWFWFAILSMLLGTISWLFALKTLSLAFAYPWTAFVYVFTPLSSAVLYNDALSFQYVFGMVFIVIGVFFTASETKKRI